MRKIIMGAIALIGLTTAMEVQAKVLERFCVCQGHARSGGLHIFGEPGTWLEGMHRAAVYYCETGQSHSYITQRAQYGARSGGAFCVPEGCPAGTIDLGTSVSGCSGVAKSRFTPGTETSNVMAPAEGGCNYDDSESDQLDQFVSCDLQCDVVRRCATATSN